MFEVLKRSLKRAARYLSKLHGGREAVDEDTQDFSKSKKRKLFSIVRGSKGRTLASSIERDQDEDVLADVIECIPTFVPTEDTSKRAHGWVERFLIQAVDEFAYDDIKIEVERSLQVSLNVEQQPYRHTSTGAWVHPFRCPHYTSGCSFKARAITRGTELVIQTRGVHDHPDKTDKTSTRGLTQKQKDVVFAWYIMIYRSRCTG